jgi:hypothetical protein
MMKVNCHVRVVRTGTSSTNVAHVNFEVLDPYELFAAMLRRSRCSMQAAYEASFAAYLRSVQLL